MALRMFDHVEEHVLERWRDALGALDRQAAFAKACGKAARINVTATENGVHCRAEDCGLLHIGHVVESAHDLDRLRRANLENGAGRKDLLQLARGAHRGKLSGTDDRESMAVLRFVKV